MKIRGRPDEFGYLTNVEVSGEEQILKELERRGVHKALAHLFLRAWLDRLYGDATAPQLELLDRHPEAKEFLESITEVEVEPCA
jgi:hypothetical protein